MTLKGRIIKGIGGFYYVDAAGVLYETRARGLFRKQGKTPLVGDIAEIDQINEDDKTAFLVGIEDRKTELIRPAVANVDQVFIIFSCHHPKPNFGLLDRYLINMEKQSVKTYIILSKTDLLDDEITDEMAGIYESAGYDVIKLSNITGEGMDKVKDILRGKMTVLSGPSGVGKSSFINGLVPEYKGETGEISKKLGKGKNTTRHAEIIPVPDMEDTFVIDTPGYTSLELLVEDENDIRYYIREFEDLNDKCKYTGCVHIAEPSCVVKEKLEAGEISEQRYKSYVDIFNEVKNRRKW